LLGSSWFLGVYLNPNSFKLLALNVLDNRFDNVKPYNVALGNKEGEVFISPDGNQRGYKTKMAALDSSDLNPLIY